VHTGETPTGYAHAGHSPRFTRNERRHAPIRHGTVPSAQSTPAYTAVFPANSSGRTPSGSTLTPLARAMTLGTSHRQRESRGTGFIGRPSSIESEHHTERIGQPASVTSW
jgi:hypothetical protein